MGGLRTERMDPPVGEMLGRFVAEASWSDVASQVHEAKRSLLNFFGTALGSANDPVVDTAIRVLRPFSSGPTASIIGRPERLDVLSAPFVNAISANLLDFDDTHLRTIIHPTAPVAAPVLAVAEELNLSGQDVILAFILGVEIECRVGNAVSPGHYARGWHITSTCGVFGAAAACSKLLGLSGMQTANALGIAASQSSGIVENLPTAAKNVSVGSAARGGLFAALLAKEGYDAAPRAIEGPLGWARAMGDEPTIQELTEGLGEQWEIAKNTYKPYPAGIVFHAVIDACLELRNKHGLSAEQVASVEVRGHTLLLERGDRPVTSERDARVSIHHSVAVAILFGAAGVREFSQEMVESSSIVSLRSKVRAEVDPALPIGAALVIVHTRDGNTFEAKVTHPRGSLEAPLTDAELNDKVRECAQGTTDCDVEQIIGAVWKLDAADRVAGLMRFNGTGR
jgi:2-methylcitrate dehydratase PrpD